MPLAVDRRRQNPSSHFTKGSLCTNIQTGPINLGHSMDTYFSNMLLAQPHRINNQTYRRKDDVIGAR